MFSLGFTQEPTAYSLSQSSLGKLSRSTAMTSLQSLFDNLRQGVFVSYFCPFVLSLRAPLLGE